MCEVLIQHPEINLNIKSAGGWTALHRAAQSGHKEVCQQILARPDFVEVDAIWYSGLDGTAMGTARDLAAEGGHVSTVQAIDESRVTLT